jgi:hypothetical protein
MTLTVPATTVHRGRTAAIGAAAGALLAILWSSDLVDSVIGQHVADALRGHDASGTAIAGTAAGLLFAFVSGFAGTFTACNIAMAASIGPLSLAGRDAGRPSVRAYLRPVGYLTLGMVAVSGTYGSVGVLLVVAVFALLMAGTRGRFRRWLAGDPVRAMVIAGGLLLALGVFDVVYWDLRVPAGFGYGWFPAAPYNM